MERKKIILGEMDGAKIWRWETPEETFTRETGKPAEVARLWLGINERGV